MTDIVDRLNDSLSAGYSELRKEAVAEITRLRAKIAEMERQEPVMWVNSSDINSSRINKERGGRGDQHTCSETKTAYHDAPLYALPGAQPAPSIPEGWKLVPIEPTHEMLYAGEDTFIPTYTGTPVSAPIDVYRAMIAAAPEAKPCP